MDYPTAAFTLAIALVGLVTVIIYKVRPRHLPHTTTSDITHEDINKIIDLLAAIEVAVRELRSLPVANQVAVESGKFPLSIVKTSPKAEIVRSWLMANPTTALSNREIAAELGVSHTLVNQIRRSIGE